VYRERYMAGELTEAVQLVDEALRIFTDDDDHLHDDRHTR